VFWRLLYKSIMNWEGFRGPAWTLVVFSFGKCTIGIRIYLRWVL
jgi:hypothetical protein